MAEQPYVITVDGPSGSGKGTMSLQLAKTLGWHFLDSGVLYRVLGYAAKQKNLPLDDASVLSQFAKGLAVSFTLEDTIVASKIWFEDCEVSQQVRTESVGNLASQLAKMPEVREALLQRQRDFLAPPGLVADGRDMGTVVFPKASLKIFLEANLATRAKRRALQLQESGVNVNLDDLLKEVKARDDRDRNRKISPLVPAQDAIIIDTSDFSIPMVFDKIMDLVRSKGLAK